MKKFFILLLGLINLGYLLQAQQVQNNQVRENNPMKAYMRPSLSIIFVNRETNISERMKSVLENFSIPDKFNNHNTNTRSITISELNNNINARTLHNFLTKNISREIVAKWFNRNNLGEFNMDLIAERGMYNASDADVIKAKASQRKTALLQDAGENLIDRTYILIYDIKKILTAEEYAKLNNKPSTDEEGYYAWYDCYVYKLEWNDSVAAVFYNELWVDETFSDAQRVEAFNKTIFPLKFVTQVSNAFGVISSTQYKDHFKNLFGSYSDKELFERVFLKIMEESETQIAQKVEDFKVKTPIFSTHPITAKIGLKEGLSVDKRFFVYEFAINNKGEKVIKRKGVVRASNKITDNRQIASGQTEPSKFYQVAGRKLYQGMLMQEYPDWGFGLTLGYGSSSGVVGEGLHVMFEINTSLYLGKINRSYPSGIKMYGTGNLATQTFMLDINNNITSTDNPEFRISSYSAGLSKDINFLRNFVLIPFIGFGIEEYANTASGLEKDKYESTFFELGSRLGINIAHNIQLLGTYTLNPIINTGYEKNNESPTLTEPELELFGEQRKTGQIIIGLRFQF